MPNSYSGNNDETAQPMAGYDSRSHPLGATISNDGVNFSVFSKHSTQVELLLFDHADDPEPSCVIALDSGTNKTYHYWHVFVPGLESGQIYAYRAHGPFAPEQGLRFDADKVLLDPYGRSVAVPDGVGVSRGSPYGANRGSRIASQCFLTSRAGGGILLATE